MAAYCHHAPCVSSCAVCHVDLCLPGGAWYPLHREASICRQHLTHRSPRNLQLSIAPRTSPCSVQQEATASQASDLPSNEVNLVGDGLLQLRVNILHQHTTSLLDTVVGQSGKIQLTARPEDLDPDAVQHWTAWMASSNVSKLPNLQSKFAKC